MAGLHSVSLSITELSQITQNNVAVAEDAGTAAIELRAQSARLGEVMSAFKLSGSGAARPQPVEPPPALPPPPPVATRVAAVVPREPAASAPSAVEFF